MSGRDGLVVVDKPAGWSSHDVVARARRLYGTRKVGHAGTLDPMATGVLVLGVGRATRLLTFLVGCDKAYDATIRLGASTVTDDAEGEVTATATAAQIDEVTDAAIAAGIAHLTGDIEQVPSAVSAIKVQGERAYARVRQGEDVTLAARPVTVSSFDVLDQQRVTDADGDHLDLQAHLEVSSGTYIRALARDLGAALGVGGHLTSLRRTRVGGIELDQAFTLEEIADRAEAGDPPLLPLGEAARQSLVSRTISHEEATALGYGQRIASAEPGRPDPVAALTEDGTLIAVLDETRAQARAHVVFAPASS